MQARRGLFSSRIPAVVACLLAFPAGAVSIQPPGAQGSSGTFQTTRVWTIHLKFDAKNWAAMEPESGATRPFGPPPMRMESVSTAFAKADLNGDGIVDEAEFKALGAKWFTSWGGSSASSLSFTQLRAGLAATFPAPNAPSGAGGPQGPGGPRLTGAQGKRNGLSAASGIDFQYVSADLDFEGVRLPGVAVRYKGNSSFMAARSSLKRSLKIDLDRSHPSQHLAGVRTLNLHNNITDPGWMNEPLSYELFRAADVPASRTAYARVYVTVPGKFDRKYFGLYSVVENVDENFAADRWRTTDGAIFKPVTRNLFEHQGDEWPAYKQAYDPKTHLTAHQKKRVIDFARLVSSASPEQFNAELPGYLDVEEFARFMAVTVWLSNMDSILGMGQNYYVYLNPEDDRFQFLPWDLDLAFGGFPGGGSSPERLNIDKPWQGPNKFLERVFANAGFRESYRASLDELVRAIATDKRIGKRVDDIAAAIRPAIAEESAQALARFDKLAAGQQIAMASPGPFGPPPGPAADLMSGLPPGMFNPPAGMPGPPRGPGPGFGRAKLPVRTFTARREASVANQLAGKEEPQSSNPFPGPGGRPGFGPGMFGPSMFLEGAFVRAMDTDNDQRISSQEFDAAFSRWYAAWTAKGKIRLDAARLKTAAAESFAPPPGRMMPPPEFRQ